MFSLPEYGGLGGTGGHSNLPTEPEKDGAPSLALSRLQLLGVGLTYSTQKHHKSWNYTRQHGNTVNSGITVTPDMITGNMQYEQMSLIRKLCWPME